MNKNAVISDMSQNLKASTGHWNMIPDVTIEDPTYTYTLPRRQTASGVADIMSHIIEGYFKKTEDAFVQDKFAEGILETCIKYGPIALKEPENYSARANIMWASSMALNGLCGSGKPGAWSCHPIEHELSAYYDMTHGVGLAILTPVWMRYVLNEDTVDKFVDYAINVWHLDNEEDKFALANKAIDATEQFFKDMGLPSKLSEEGITDEYFTAMAKHAVIDGGLADAYVPLNDKNVEEILKTCFIMSIMNKRLKNMMISSYSLSLLSMCGMIIFPALNAIGDYFNQIPFTFIQMLITIPNVFMIIGSFMAHKITSFFSIKKIFLFCTLIILLSGLMPFITSQFSFIFISRILKGFSIGLLTTVNSSMITLLFDEQDKQHILGINSVIESFGGTFMVLLSSILATYSWQICFLVYLVALIPLFIVLMKCENNSLKIENTKHESFMNKNILIFILMIFVYMTFLNVFSTNISSFIINHHISIKYALVFVLLFI